MEHRKLIRITVLALAVSAAVLLWQRAHAPESPRDALETEGAEGPVHDTVPDAPLSLELQASIDALADRIVVSEPVPLATVGNPLIVRGKARGPWFFEASFPVVVVNWDGLIIGEGVATAEGDWMTEDFVPFTATVSFTREPDSYSNRGALILKRDNPSGLPANDAALEIPITLP